MDDCRDEKISSHFNYYTTKTKLLPASMLPRTARSGEDSLQPARTNGFVALTGLNLLDKCPVPIDLESRPSTGQPGRSTPHPAHPLYSMGSRIGPFAMDDPPMEKPHLPMIRTHHVLAGRLAARGLSERAAGRIAI